MKRILLNKEGKKFFVKDISKNYHTQFGFFKAKDLKKEKGKIKSSAGKEFLIFNPGFDDLYSRIKRGPQIIMRKDVGAIIAETGVGKKSKVVDCGVGSGALSCALGNIVKEVIGYEINKNFAKIAVGNVKMLGLKNVTIKNKDCLKMNEKDVDLITVDLPEPAIILKKAAKSLKNGGRLVAYLPSMTQVISFVKKVKGDFTYIRTMELIKRKWTIKGRIARPETKMLGHTGFLVFIRKIV